MKTTETPAGHNRRRLTYSEIIGRFMNTPNKRMAWLYKNTARSRYPEQYKDSDFVRPIEFLGNNVPHTRRSYEELVSMYHDTKYRNKSLVRRHAQEIYPNKFLETDFPIANRRLSYREIVDKYAIVIAGRPDRAGNYTYSCMLRAKAKAYYPELYCVTDFPSRWETRQYSPNIKRLSYEMIVARYIETISSNKKTCYHSVLKKLAMTRYPDRFTASDFPTKIEYRSRQWT